MSVVDLISFITSHPLNRDAKLRSLLRFARWQIGSRLIPGDVVYEWINGAKFLVRNGETGLTGNIYTGLHEFPDMGFLLHFLRPEELFIDVGANVGSYTILACAAVGARGYAFEPVPNTYKRLLENMRINHLESRVRSLNLGVGSEPGTIRFTSGLDTVNHALASGEVCEQSVQVEISTLDVILKDQNPALMKIDVEGYETPVLAGAVATLQKPSLRAVIMELNGSGQRYGYDESQILATMHGYGFGTYSYDPLTRKLIGLGGKNMASGNTLFIRDEAFVAEKLKAAPHVTIHGKQV